MHDLLDPPMLGTKWLLLLVLVPLLLIGISRLPVVGRILRLAITLALVGLAALVLSERAPFDPYLQRIAMLLRLDPGQHVNGSELRVPMAADGHFWVRARIGGIERRMLVDSGATVTAISADTAAAAGLHPRPGIFPIFLRTANGTIPAESATVGELRLGNIVARDLPVVVSPGLDDMDVLGMNFLSELKSWRVEGRTLVLVPHHPQGETNTGKA